MEKYRKPVKEQLERNVRHRIKMSQKKVGPGFLAVF